MNNSVNSKMPPRTAGIFSIILLLAVSVTWWLTRNYYNNCEANDREFSRIKNSLQHSSKLIQRDCEEDSAYVVSKLHDPGIREKAIEYKPKIDSVIILARRMHNYIEDFKSSFHLLADYENDDKLKNEFQNTDKWRLSDIKITKNLYDSLCSYSRTLSKILPFKIQNYNFPMPIDTVEPTSKNVAVWQKNYFDGLTKPAMLATLSELDYQVWLSANEMTNILSTQWCNLLQIDDKVRYFLTNQNSNYFLPGQTLEISAGLGAYVTNIKPQIFINGQEQIVNAEGYTVFTKTISGGKGGFIPITISYKDPNTGEMKTMFKQISYTVLQTQKK